jgi:hypothetical protein
MKINTIIEPCSRSQYFSMSIIIRQVTAVTLVLVSIGMITSCGGGPMRKGGAGIFASSLPDEPIAMNDLPPSVKTQAEVILAGMKVEGVIRNARPRDGRRYYTITYSDKADGVKQVSYWGDGTPRTLKK